MQLQALLVIFSLLLCYYLQFIQTFLNTILFVNLPSLLSANNYHNNDSSLAKSNLYSQSSLILSSKQSVRFVLILLYSFCIDRINKYFLLLIIVSVASASQIGLLLAHNSQHLFYMWVLF